MAEKNLYSTLYLGVLLLFDIDFLLSFSVNICRGASEDKRITCPENMLIIIHQATVVYNDPLICGDDVVGFGGNPSVFCRSGQSEIFRRCYGRETCEVRPADAHWQLSGCSDSPDTNFLLVEYICISLPEHVKAQLPITADISASEIYLFSPGFPDAMPPGKYSFYCTVSTAYVQLLTVTIRKYYMNLNASTAQCVERLHFLESQAFIQSNCNQREDWNTVDTYNVTGPVAMSYTKQSGSYGGRFWLRFTGQNYRGGNVVLNMTCPEQSQIPTTTFTTSTPGPHQETSPQDTTTTTTAELDTQHNTTGGVLNQTENGSNNATFYGIIGGLICLVLIFVAVAAFFYLKSRRQKRSENSKTVSATNGSVDNAPVPENNPSGTEYAYITDNTLGYVNTPRMYTTPLPLGSGDENQTTDEYDYVSNPTIDRKVDHGYENTNQATMYEDLKAESREEPETPNKVYDKLTE